MATSEKFALARFMATADCLIHFEATVNTPGASTSMLFLVANGSGSIRHMLRLHCGCRRERRRHQILTEIQVFPNVLHL